MFPVGESWKQMKERQRNWVWKLIDGVQKQTRHGKKKKSRTSLKTKWRRVGAASVKSDNVRQDQTFSVIKARKTYFNLPQTENKQNFNIQTT